tara:strand:+ start:574 stop:774 length:201 start_codon:yes stop_codon:yes gene_type:complete
LDVSLTRREDIASTILDKKECLEAIGICEVMRVEVEGSETLDPRSVYKVLLATKIPGWVERCERRL